MTGVVAATRFGQLAAAAGRGWASEVDERVGFALGHVPTPWVLALVGLAATLAIAEALWAVARPEGDARPRVRIAIAALRIIGVLALLAIAFELTWRRERVSPAARRVAVLIDRSATVALADASEPASAAQARAARALELWQRSAPALERWAAEGLVLDVRRFDRRVSPVDGDPAALLAEPATGDGSDLAAALLDLDGADPLETRPLVGVVVIADGIEPLGIRAGAPAAQDDRDPAAADSERDAARDLAADPALAAAKALGVPVTVAALGAPSIRDVAVSTLRAGEFAFVENVATFEADLLAHGLAGSEVRVRLRRDGEEVASREITLGADGEPVPVTFEVAPDRVGQFVYAIEVDPLADEATVANNARAFVIKVLRDKVRVLHVSGRPDWDVRALRTLLRRDPNVELLSYYILRSYEDIDRERPDAPLSLIRFPTEDLFESELGSFDLVVMHNFDPVRHEVGAYLPNIAEYVSAGGALVVIGGDLGLATGEYSTESIARLLPVDASRAAPYERGPVRPGLTEAGRRHPITAWLREGPGRSGWRDLPALDGWNRATLAPHARDIRTTVLLEHPEAKDARGAAIPLLSVAEPGKGRVLVLSTGATWQLGFSPDLTAIDGARPYDLLWRGAVRWLLRDEAAQRLRLETDKPRYGLEDEIVLQAAAVDPSYAPESGAALTWSVHPLAPSATATTNAPAAADAGVPAAPSGAAPSGSPAKDGAAAPADAAGPPPPRTPAIAKGEWQTDATGRAEARLPPLPPGAYEARARRAAALAPAGAAGAPGSTDTEAAAEARRVFLVAPPTDELERVDADEGTARLAAIAAATGGASVRAVDGAALPADLPIARDTPALAAMRVESREDTPVWSGWLPLLILVSSLGAEWLLRRRSGAA